MGAVWVGIWSPSICCSVVGFRVGELEDKGVDSDMIVGSAFSRSSKRFWLVLLKFLGMQSGSKKMVMRKSGDNKEGLSNRSS